MPTVLITGASRGIGRGAAFAFAPLPDWSSAASGPLRPTNAPASGPGVLTIVADNWSSSTYGYTLALDGTYRFTVPFETTDMGWTGYALEGTPPPASMADIAALDVVICDPATGGNLVMLWGPDLHEQARIQGVDTDSPTISPFGSTSGTISISRAASGPPEIDLDEVEPLLPSSRNWYRSWLAATNPPAPPAGPVVLDALVLPAAGCVSPRRDADGPLVEVFVAEPAEEGGRADEVEVFLCDHMRSFPYRMIESRRVRNIFPIRGQNHGYSPRRILYLRQKDKRRPHPSPFT